MDSQRRFSVQTRLFLLTALFTWILTFTFFALQYSREREYKTNLLDSRLQRVNERVLDHIAAGDSVTPALIDSLSSFSGDTVRLSLIDFNGNVIFDSGKSSSEIGNHKDRPEFKEAMAHGHGFTRRRLSATSNREYFYSATRGKTLVARSALPYNHSLATMLQADPVQCYAILAVALILTIMAWFATHSISRVVKKLRDFANEAEFGDISKYDSSSFPDDELGDISRHIVNLYKILQSTADERDRNLREAMYEQRDKERIKHQLTNNISHEIKTPVHVIQACLETVENNNLDDDTRKSLIDKAYQNVKRLTSLLADLSVITRISDAPDQIQLEPVDVTAVINRVADDMKVFPPSRQMRIHIDVPEGVSVNGNLSLIESIFRNLFTNAFNYSGGRDVRVAMTDETSDYYTFTFADNGIGVPPEHLNRIFERFYRVDTGRSRALGGTGLGLSIVKNAVLFHKGKISVENQYNGGLKFTFTLHK